MVPAAALGAVRAGSAVCCLLLLVSGSAAPACGQVYTYPTSWMSPTRTIVLNSGSTPDPVPPSCDGVRVASSCGIPAEHTFDWTGFGFRLNPINGAVIGVEVQIPVAFDATCVSMTYGRTRNATTLPDIRLLAFTGPGVAPAGLTASLTPGQNPFAVHTLTLGSPSTLLNLPAPPVGLSNAVVSSAEFGLSATFTECGSCPSYFTVYCPKMRLTYVLPPPTFAPPPQIWPLPIPTPMPTSPPTKWPTPFPFPPPPTLMPSERPSPPPPPTNLPTQMPTSPLATIAAPRPTLNPTPLVTPLPTPLAAYPNPTPPALLPEATSPTSESRPGAPATSPAPPPGSATFNVSLGINTGTTPPAATREVSDGASVFSSASPASVALVGTTGSDAVPPDAEGLELQTLLIIIAAVVCCNLCLACGVFALCRYLRRSRANRRMQGRSRASSSTTTRPSRRRGSNTSGPHRGKPASQSPSFRRGVRSSLAFDDIPVKVYDRVPHGTAMSAYDKVPPLAHPKGANGVGVGPTRPRAAKNYSEWGFSRTHAPSSRGSARDAEQQAASVWPHGRVNHGAAPGGTPRGSGYQSTSNRGSAANQQQAPAGHHVLHSVTPNRGSHVGAAASAATFGLPPARPPPRPPRRVAGPSIVYSALPNQ